MKSWGQILCMFAYIRLENFFKSHVSKEKAMPGAPIVNKLPGNVPVFLRTVSPIGELLRYINHMI